jgi:hypothetical protein
MENYNFLIGKTLNEVKEIAQNYGLSTRTNNVDGVPMLLTADFKPNRLNLCVENGIVTEITFG